MRKTARNDDAKLLTALDHFAATFYDAGERKICADAATEIRRLRGVIVGLREDMLEKVMGCCGEQAGYKRCEKFGCGTLKKLADTWLKEAQ